MSKYRVWFTIRVSSHLQAFETGLGPANFKDGFWVNKDLEHSNASDVLYWVPPSQLLYIEKVPA